MLVDFGLMDLWTHDDPPFLLPGILDDDAVESANCGADFRIEGDDAVQAGRVFERQPHPLFIYDIPRHGIPEVREDFASVIEQSGFHAQLVQLPERMAPRQRAEHCLSHFCGAGEVFLHGVHIIVVDSLPIDRPLRVEGEMMGEGEYAHHWRNISLLASPHLEIASSRKIGNVAVDMARLMFCDLDAAGKWLHQESTDGLADFVFWGKDALRLAKKFQAPHVEGAMYGWVDKPIEEIIELSIQAQKHISHHHLVAATDFRPHSDHWRMLKTIAGSETESAVIELGGTSCCGFMTSWGDGFFPVYLDEDENGTLVRVRVELGTEEIIRGMQLVNRFA